jgi:hypothetical protein
MNDYNVEAIDFLKNNNVSLKISKAQKTVSEICNSAKGCFEGETSKHDKYRFTLTTAKGSYWSMFWNSTHDTEKGIIPTEYDILACLSVDYSEDFKDFCEQFGYEQYLENDYGKMVRNASAYHTYKAVKKQSEGLERIFSEKQLELLHDIA